MRRMLVNATQREELRVAMVDGQKLYDLDIESQGREQKKANIYKGRITRLEPSLEAAFVDYGAQRHGFLPLKEISREYFVKESQGGGRLNIRDVLREGQEIVIQVEKEERGNKGAALTTFLSLAGRFLVLMPNNPRAGGVSRRITGQDRDEIRDAMKDLEVPQGMGAIVRTAGVDRTAEELQWDLDYLLQVWEAIKTSVVQRAAPFLIYQESNTMLRALRDHFSNEVGEIIVDDDVAFGEAREFIERVMPHNVRKLKHYVDPVPLFTRFQIESQIESAFSHAVELPSGGSVVIDHTEALVSIDINSARATKGEDIEATALNTNLEAADEIARQLRIRDIGGLIVIDFIDMGPQKNQREVENRLRDAVRMDRARVQIGRISRFGLLEMSRQRLRPSLGESAHMVCPRCLGRGTVRDVESLALSVLRLLGEEARKERTAKVIAELPVDVGTYLLNEKRSWLTSIEERESVHVIIVPRTSLESPHFNIRRVRDDAMRLPENAPPSYQLPEIEEEESATKGTTGGQPAAGQAPAVSGIVPATPAPAPKKRPEATKPGLFARLIAWLSSGTQESKKKAPPSKKPRSSDRKRPEQKGQGRSGGRRRGGRGGGKQGDSRSGRGGRRPARQAGDQDAQKKGSKKASESKSDSSGNRSAGTDSKAEGSGSSRGRRGGRRRRRGGGRQRQEPGSQQQNQDATNNQRREPAQNKAATTGDQRREPAQNKAASTGDQRREPTQRKAEVTGSQPDPQRSPGKEASQVAASEPRPRMQGGKGDVATEGRRKDAAAADTPQTAAAAAPVNPVSERDRRPGQETSPAAATPKASKPAASKPVDRAPASKPDDRPRASSEDRAATSASREPATSEKTPSKAHPKNALAAAPSASNTAGQASHRTGSSGADSPGAPQPMSASRPSGPPPDQGTAGGADRPAARVAPDASPARQPSPAPAGRPPMKAPENLPNKIEGPRPPVTAKPPSPPGSTPAPAAGTQKKAAAAPETVARPSGSDAAKQKTSGTADPRREAGD
ncbi:MAG: Rne/Rng family ribonuclease [Chromatiales bacterium]|nr:Rne/Rng family ribonuclease [Chromatiales bacterium]